MKNVWSYSLKSICTVSFLMIMVTGCKKDVANTANSPHGISIYLTDDPSLVFDNIFLDIQKVEVKNEDDTEVGTNDHHSGESAGDDDGSNSAGWTTLQTKAGVFDILAFRNGLDMLLSTGAIPGALPISKIRLTLGANNKVVLNGVTSPLSLKKNFVVINLEDELVKRNEQGSVQLWLDFDAGRSVRLHKNQFELEPQIKAFTKDKTGGIEGRVMPAQAKVIVMAINGTDTSTAKPEREGEFKIRGLKPGSYKLLFKANANNYRDAIIENVVVKAKEDTKTGTVTLHQ